MEDVLGGRTEPRRFHSFLNDWEAILERRVAEAVATLAAVEGVRGLVLAGSLGRGEAWPLSDIDILPIYDADRMGEAIAEVERRRPALLEPWIAEGWWTGLDVGRLRFTSDEVRRVVTSQSDHDPTTILSDDRWYYSVDKGFRGRAIYDPDGTAAVLAAWFTEQRFNPSVVRFRLDRLRQEIHDGLDAVRDSARSGDMSAGTRALRRTAVLLMTHRLEGWGERDNSQGRLGTRFERITAARGLPELADRLHALTDLDDASVERRMAAAPDWVHERHDRSWRARQRIGEPAARLQDARDTLRVCSLYEIRRLLEPPYPEWLAIPPNADSLGAKAEQLSTMVAEWLGTSMEADDAP